MIPIPTGDRPVPKHTSKRDEQLRAIAAINVAVEFCGPLDAFGSLARFDRHLSDDERAEVMRLFGF